MLDDIASLPVILRDVIPKAPIVIVISNYRFFRLCLGSQTVHSFLQPNCAQYLFTVEIVNLVVLISQVHKVLITLLNRSIFCTINRVFTIVFP